jgi:predicted nucleotidyltransferase component of viral defense system
MIPAQNIVAWSAIVPWADNRQVEQDLIISRALVEIFTEPLLKRELRFRGGTALNKLHFPKPLRYSEDIDLVRTSTGPIKPVIDALRDRFEPWLGPAEYIRSKVAPKLRFRVAAEQAASAEIRLKAEINTSEIQAFDPAQMLNFEVSNPWYSGAADIPTFSREEMLATKLRALLQRDKGRDLYDLNHALQVFENLDADHTVGLLAKYLALDRQSISKAQAQERMFAKLAKSSFASDMRPLLSAEQASQLTDEASRDAFLRVFETLINRLPGEDWAKAPMMKERFGLS